MINFPKNNNHMFFVNDPKEIDNEENEQEED